MGIRDLVKVANRLDNLGLNSEADALDRIIRKIAEEPQGMVAPAGETYSNKSIDDITPKRRDDMIAAAKQTYNNHNDLARLTLKPEFKDAFIKKFIQHFTSPSDYGGYMDYKDYAEYLANWMWNTYGTKEEAPAAPSPAPKPKAPISGWDSYVSKVPNGSAVKAMWVDNSGKVLAGDNSFESFRRWLKDFMTKTQVKSIGAIDLVVNLQRMTDIKRAKNSDMRSKRNYDAPNSVEAAMEKAHNIGDKAEIKRLRDRLDIEEKTSYI